MWWWWRPWAPFQMWNLLKHRIDFRCLGALRKGESCRWVNDVCEAAASRSHNDLISCHNVGGCEARECAFLTLPHQRMPLKSLCVSLKALSYISWSLMCLFLWQPLLFLAPLFHLSDCLSFSSPPQPASVCHADPPLPLPLRLSASFSPPNVPLSFPPCFFLLCLLRSPPMGAILEQKKKDGRDSLTWQIAPHLLYSCQGNHSYRDVSVWSSQQ